MISKEQIAYELTMTYMHNRYGVDVSGTLFITSNDENRIDGSGSINTITFQAPKNLKI